MLNTHDVTKNLHINILALLPQESIVDSETDLPVTEEIILTMPNLEALYLMYPVVSDGFLLADLKGPNAHNKLLPSSQQSVILQICRSCFLPNCAENVPKTRRKCA